MAGKSYSYQNPRLDFDSNQERLGFVVELRVVVVQPGENDPFQGTPSGVPQELASVPASATAALVAKSSG
jgi:hypothetical protein